MPHLGANREAEQHELNGRNADEHRQRQPVAPHLDELLLQHRHYVGAAETEEAGHYRFTLGAAATAAPPVVAPCSVSSSFSWSETKTSSIVDWPNMPGISDGVPTAIRCPRDRNARRVHCDASSI